MPAESAFDAKVIAQSAYPPIIMSIFVITFAVTYCGNRIIISGNKLAQIGANPQIVNGSKDGCIEVIFNRQQVLERLIGAFNADGREPCRIK